jgi:hypothetical protein
MWEFVAPRWLLASEQEDASMASHSVAAWSAEASGQRPIARVATCCRLCRHAAKKSTSTFASAHPELFKPRHNSTSGPLLAVLARVGKEDDAIAERSPAMKPATVGCETWTAPSSMPQQSHSVWARMRENNPMT